MKDVGNLDLRQTPEGVVVAVKVVPGASRDRIAGVLGDALKITTAAAPEKGKANAAVARTLAKALGIDRRRVRLVAGHTSSRKQFLVGRAGIDAVAAALRDKL